MAYQKYESTSFNRKQIFFNEKLFIHRENAKNTETKQNKKKCQKSLQMSKIRTENKYQVQLQQITKLIK